MDKVVVLLEDIQVCLCEVHEKEQIAMSEVRTNGLQKGFEVIVTTRDVSSNAFQQSSLICIVQLDMIGYRALSFESVISPPAVLIP
jgi:hypothetical protein